MEPVADTGCCPRFDPAPWQDQEITWDARPFVKQRVRCFLHIPLTFGRVMVRTMARLEAAGAVDPEMIVLAGDEGPWGMDVFISYRGELPAAPDLTTLSGTFLTRVYEGPYRHAGRWHKDMQAHVAAAGKTLRRMFSYYTTCPRCAKAYGKNYVVLLAQV